MVSKITDKILPEVKEWQSRPLNPVYPFVFIVAVHYKIKKEGRILNRAACIVSGATLDGTKDILSITIGANESSKFWLGMLNDLKNRGVMDVLFFCVDGPAGFKEAVYSVYPDAQVQRCIIHTLLSHTFHIPIPISQIIFYNQFSRYNSLILHITVKRPATISR